MTPATTTVGTRAKPKSVPKDLQERIADHIQQKLMFLLSDFGEIAELNPSTGVIEVISPAGITRSINTKLMARVILLLGAQEPTKRKGK